MKNLPSHLRRTEFFIGDLQWQ